MVDERMIYILCPICGELHTHGSGGLENISYGGRVQHCYWPSKIVPEPNLGYDIQPSERTVIKRDGLATSKDLKQFRGILAESKKNFKAWLKAEEKKIKEKKKREFRERWNNTIGKQKQ